MMYRWFLSLILGCSIFSSGSLFAAEPEIDFNRDVRPILSNSCYKCHGPATQKAKLRLDAFQHATKNGAIVVGKPDDSEILYRVTSKEESEHMPPPGEGKALTPAQVETLRLWIAQGAKYAPHWSFVAPKKAAVPDLGQDNAWVKNPIDAFILAKLKEKNIRPSQVADRRTLIRRVYLDLVGLLPTPEQVNAFVVDRSPNAYEKVVDALLQSPHFGERQARHWLDLARYADSNGFTVDSPRSIWPWRDWVINAYNRDLPFDQFTIEQLAGDLLPKPTEAQLVATGFQRNTPLNQEGGSDPEQFRVERTIDRTNTVGAVWLGLTLACSQCHDHKFDAITQKDYYEMYAFFNNCDEPNLTLAPPEAVQKKLDELSKQLAEFKKEKKADDIKKIEAEIKKLRGQIPSTLVLSERTKNRRDSFVQIRGDFLRPGEQVQPTALSALPAITKKQANRLDLARWLVSSNNPLTARVTVNRHWQQLFGQGIVSTENDFGMQGDLPTHPALLDWLAVEFQEQAWSTKKILKTMVMSNTYRQASVTRPDLQTIDPDNKLLARQNRLRVESEIIRDVALSASGLLSKKVGGPGVYPPLPSEVFSFTQNKKPWPESRGEDRYRRGIYTFIYRQSQHHLTTTFDGADAQVSCTKRNRSNTPLQALHLANDEVFIEIAEALGQRIDSETKGNDTNKIDYAFELCFSRKPTDTERERLLEFLQQQRQQNAKTAWTMTARVLMNLDEFITRE